jgi:hypothetical protein
MTELNHLYDNLTSVEHDSTKFSLVDNAGESSTFASTHPAPIGLPPRRPSLALSGYSQNDGIKDNNQNSREDLLFITEDPTVSAKLPYLVTRAEDFPNYPFVKDFPNSSLNQINTMASSSSSTAGATAEALSSDRTISNSLNPLNLNNNNPIVTGDQENNERFRLIGAGKVRTEPAVNAIDASQPSLQQNGGKPLEEMFSKMNVREEEDHSKQQNVSSEE